MPVENKPLAPVSRPVEITTATTVLRGELTTMPKARAVVVVVHPSGSTPAKARIDRLLPLLQAEQVATLVIDSLSGAEENHEEGPAPASGHANLRCRRLMAACEWLDDVRALQRLPLGVFATNSAVTAALSLAAMRPGGLFALVSYAGRPDAVGADLLARVRTPTLLMVDRHDARSLAENRAALGHLGGECKLDALDEQGVPVAARALDWFVRQLDAGKAQTNTQPTVAGSR